jgi:hypothetical protein
MTDIEHMKKKIEELEAGNQRSYEELLKATQGRATIDTSDFRRELLIEKLIEWGIVTEEQRLQFELEFHTKVEEAINNTWAKFREAQGRAKLSVVKKSAPKLLGPDGKAL